MKPSFGTYYRLAASPRITLFLFFGLVPLLVLRSIDAPPRELLAIPVHGLLVLLSINLACCTVSRFSSLRTPTVIIHAGTLITLAGCLAGQLGYVATINIHEGSSTDTVYRWDLERDYRLDFRLAVTEINLGYYPVGVKIGVLDGNEKSGLFVLKTGEEFEIGKYRIQTQALDPETENLTLRIMDRDGRRLGIYETAGASEPPAGFPYDFKLVAYQDPVVKNIRVDLEIHRDGRVVASGGSSVNDPFIWEGLRFYNTSIDRDPYGYPYAGIQIVKDPGIPLVYLGFLILAAGAAGHLYRLMKS